jgi:tight adherence protein B
MNHRRIIVTLIFLCLAVLTGAAAGEEDLLSLGITAYKEGRFEEAVNYLAQYRQQNPPSEKACQYHALALNSLGRADEAMTEVEGGLARHPKSVDLIIVQGKLLAGMGHYQDAAAILSRAIKLDPKRGEAWKERGAVRAKMNLPKEAAKDLDQAVRLAPEDPETFIQRGLFRVGQGKLKPAEQDFQTAIKLSPDQPEAFFQRGTLYFYHWEPKEKEKALADFEEACRLGHAAGCQEVKKIKALDQAQVPPEQELEIPMLGQASQEEETAPATGATINFKLPGGGETAVPQVKITRPPTAQKPPRHSYTLENTIYPLFRGIPYPLILITFLCFLCLVEGTVLALSDTDRRHQRRLKKRMKFLEDLEKKGPAVESLLKVDKFSGIPWIHQTLKRIRRLEQIQTLLNQAGVSWSVGHFVLLSLLLSALGFCLGFFKFGPLGGLAGGALVGIIPTYLLRFKKKQRLKKFEKQLPEALDLLARGLKAGHAFASGLQLVASEMENPIGMEFFKTFKEYNHGLDLNTALQNLCYRMDLRDLRYFTTAVMIQRETGGNLTEILEKIASLIRERFKLRNQIKALTAEGRLSGWVLMLMTPAMALIILKINPDYIMLLYTHPLGHMMALTAMFFQVMGMLCIRKIVNIKV